jgi:spermidine synthase
LAEGGVFCQWLPLHQLDLDTLRSIVRSYLTVYPHGAALLATLSLDTPTIGLISHRDGEPFDVEQVRTRIDAAQTFGAEHFGITDDFSLLGSFIAGPRFLTKFAGKAALNTDDRPVVAYRAPNITYAPTSTPRDRLVELLREAEISPSELLTGYGDSSTRLIAYWTARNQFIAAGRDVRPSSDVREMLAQVRQPLLGVLHTSPDFRPAYDPLLRMAAALSRVDREAARSLLNELQQAQPARPEAGDVLHALTTE